MYSDQLTISGFTKIKNYIAEIVTFIGKFRDPTFYFLIHFRISIYFDPNSINKGGYYHYKQKTKQNKTKKKHFFVKLKEIPLQLCKRTYII